MSLFAGLDISVKTTAICVLDANGRVLLETMVDSAPEAIAGRLHECGQPFERIGLEAGPLSQWIYAGLVDVGLAAICVETRHMHAAHQQNRPERRPRDRPDDAGRAVQGSPRQNSPQPTSKTSADLSQIAAAEDL